MYDLNSDKELNGDFRMADHDDISEPDNAEHIPREKLIKIKNNRKNKQKLSNSNGKIP